ncbi:MAG: hypothetical protein QXH91_01230 [Candidatus Bathyarchaeia archaeon]
MIRDSAPITQAELARIANFSKAKLSGVLDVLEAYGLIIKKRRGRGECYHVVDQSASTKCDRLFISYSS